MRYVPLVAALLTFGHSLHAGAQATVAGPMRDAVQLDLAGKTTDARVILQRVADTATDLAAKAAVHRAIAMSYAFDGDCVNTLRHERMVIEY